MVRKGPVHFERHPGVASATPPTSYVRREPERTILYQVVKDHLRTFLAEARERSEHGFGLPRFVERELERYLACGLLCHGFARVRCDECGHECLSPSRAKIGTLSIVHDPPGREAQRRFAQKMRLAPAEANQRLMKPSLRHLLATSCCAPGMLRATSVTWVRAGYEHLARD